MNRSTRTLFVLASLFGSFQTYAQLRVSIQPVRSADLPNQQTLQANVTGGSGEYLYGWGIAKGVGTVSENSSSALVTVTYYQDAEYMLFVRDKKTGAMAYTTVPVKAAVKSEAHLIKLPGEQNNSPFRYTAKGALPAWAK